MGQARPLVPTGRLSLPAACPYLSHLFRFPTAPIPGTSLRVQFPVLEIAADLRAAIAAGDRSRVLLKAPTGSGKSTTVPGILLDAGTPGMILVIQPHSLALRS